jgi:hypothetical protein
MVWLIACGRTLDATANWLELCSFCVVGLCWCLLSCARLMYAGRVSMVIYWGMVNYWALQCQSDRHFKSALIPGCIETTACHISLTSLLLTDDTCLQQNFEVGVDVENALAGDTRRLPTLSQPYMLTHTCMDPRVNSIKV